MAAEPQLAPEVARQDRCPGCGSAHWDKVGPSGTEFITTVKRKKFVQPDYDSRCCRDCGLIFKSIIASASILDEYYQQVDFSKWESPVLFPNEKAVLAMLSALPAGSRVLDFGCSTGRLLSHLVGTMSVFGCEINTEAARLAEARGLSMVSAEELLGPGDMPPFDAIVMVDVFEHLTEPTRLLGLLTKRLAPRGQLIVCTGDADAPAVRGDPSNFWYFRNIEHLCMLTSRYAEYAAKVLGLKLTHWQRVSHYYSTRWARFGQWYRNIAFESFHRGRRAWLKPVFGMLPGGAKARAWKERPVRNLTEDHVVAVFVRDSVRSDFPEDHGLRRVGDALG